jgi:hypothetical protein
MTACLLSDATRKIASLLIGTLLFAAGCQSTPKVDWNSRVGNYSFDQAVAEMGPPDKSSKLSDGSLVAEWAVGRPSGGVSFGVGTGYWGRHTGVGVGQTVSSGGSQKFLRLTFSADGQLTAHGTGKR